MPRRLLWFLIPIFIIVLGLCALTGYFLWTSVTVDPPGKGPQAELGYQVCAPVITALAHYHEQNNSYPKTLDLLVPTFLVAVPAAQKNLEIDYRANQTSYFLEFHYSGPGMNTCVYTPETGWKCSGFY